MNDSKSLHTIISLTKLAKVLSMIVLVLTIIGLVCCALMLALSPRLGSVLAEIDWEDLTSQLSPSQLAQFNELFGSFDQKTIIGLMNNALIVGVIGCAASAVAAFLAYRYFKSVIAAGTPFTFPGANALRTLGIVSLCTSLGTSVISSLIMGSEINISLGGSLAPGIAFLVVSLIFRHGAELREKAEAAALPSGEGM